jgi:phospholipid/cholesterol/gamma-HCH transport system ATP-binding protein
MDAPLLRFSQVQKRLGGLPVILGLDAVIEAHAFTCIVGPSGSGKSVLCRLGVGLLRADAGSVSLLDERIEALSERRLIALRARVPYVSQSSSLLDWLTLEQNAELAARSTDASVRIPELLRQVGIDAFATRTPPTVGPGVRKRAAIARALVLNPVAVILDEPTTGLDRRAASQVVDVLRQLKADGIGVVAVTHDRGLVRELADTVLELRQGQMEYCGKVQPWMSRNSN